MWLVDCDAELAPVTHMLKTADSQQFKAYLKEGNYTAPASATIILDDDDDKEDEDSDEDDRPSTADSEMRREMVTPPFSHTSSRSPAPGDETTPPKKKRNSYADSPHKLECPYCPRAFPWVSSLNRHILTHTGKSLNSCVSCISQYMS